MSRCARKRAGLLLALVLLSGSLQADMIAVPGGETRIGDDHGHPDERPSFVTQVSAFELDRAPVSVAEFARYAKQHDIQTDADKFGSAAVMRFGTGRWRLVAGANWLYPLGPDAAQAQPDHPVTQVSWNDAKAYCAAHGKRLPSEIEFEYAARLAGHGDKHAFGRRLVKDGRYMANVWTGMFPLFNSKADGYKSTSPVGAFGQDALGFEDLAGNVWEWTADWYQPYAGEPRQRPNEKIQRGGSFLCDPNVCYGFRVSARAHATPDSSLMHTGFRCARDRQE